MKMKKNSKNNLQNIVYSYKRKEEMSQINQDSTLRSQKQKSKIKQSDSKEIINIRAKINKIEKRKAIEKINEAKGWFFAKVNKTDECLARMKVKKEREEDLPYAKGNENERNMITIHTKVISSSVW